MVAVGVLMVAVSALTVFLTSEPMPVAVAVIGLVFLGVGRRQTRRSANPVGEPQKPIRDTWAVPFVGPRDGRFQGRKRRTGVRGD